MMHTFHMHKQRDYAAAYRWSLRVKSEDWKLAARNWLRKREQSYLAKKGDQDV
jgi:hypothetical protein